MLLSILAPADGVASADGGAARLVMIASLEQPVALAFRASDEALYVAEKVGRVRSIQHGETQAKPVLDLSAEVAGDKEQGLLGLAFSPDGTLLYASFTDREGTSRLQEFAVVDGIADLTSRRELLAIAEPTSIHNIGQVLFGPDGYLYVGFGDGGEPEDASDRAQSLSTLLGKILRLDTRPDEGAPYRIPPDNPLVGVEGTRPEIWAYGLRNPWRFSLDRLTGDLWIGDVGSDAVEEIDLHRFGAPSLPNFGWNRFEGSRPHRGEPPSEHVLPIYEYEHGSGGCAVIGGLVYRGVRLPELSGAYLFADLCRGRMNTLRIIEGGPEIGSLGLEVSAPVSFGEDAAGEIYVLSLAGGVYRLDPA